MSNFFLEMKFFFFKSCFICNSSGRVECYVCKGCAKLKWFVQMTVQFTNNEDEFFKKDQTQDIPDELTRSCHAKNIFTEQNDRVKKYKQEYFFH